MNEMLSYCGLVCNTCPIYLATCAPNKDEQARSRAEVFRICTEQYGMKITPADITDCDGCRTEGGRLFSACIECGIRACAREKKLENCAHCGDYPCSGLVTFFSPIQLQKYDWTIFEKAYKNRSIPATNLRNAKGCVRGQFLLSRYCSIPLAPWTRME